MSQLRVAFSTERKQVLVEGGGWRIWLLRGLRVSYSSRLSDCVVDACQLTGLEKCKNTNLARLFSEMTVPV